MCHLHDFNLIFNFLENRTSLQVESMNRVYRPFSSLCRLMSLTTLFDTIKGDSQQSSKVKFSSLS